MGRIAGKVALITGAASGIGAATARRMIAEGAKLLAVDRDPAALSRLAADLGPDVVTLELDITSESANQRMVQQAVEHFGRLDIAVLNAGTEGRFGTICDLPTAEFDAVMALNLRAVWLGLKALMPMMRAEGGSIVISASIAGLRGSAGWAAYSASKHAVLGLAKSAALEGAAHRIRVNSIAPAPVRTRMIDAIDAQMRQPGAPDPAAARAARIPLGRYGEAEEVAALILFLASDEAQYCTGATYSVDGGALNG